MSQFDLGTPNPLLAEQLEARWRRIHRRHAILYALLACVATLLLLWEFFSGALGRHPVVATFAFGLVCFQAIIAHGQLLFMKRVPLDEATDELLGPKFTKQDIRAIVHETTEPFEHAWEHPNIYLNESKQGNAMAVNALLLNFIKPLNAVYINTHLLHVLTYEELRAVVAHEMAHFQRYMSPFNRHALAGLLFVGAASFAIVLLIGWIFGWNWFAIVVGLFLANKAALITLAWAGSGGDHEAELLSDHYAARHFGTLPAINALLKLCLRAEVYHVLFEEVARIIETNTDQDIHEVIETAEKVLPHGVITPEMSRPLLSNALASIRGDKSIFDAEFDGDLAFKQRRKTLKKLRADLEKRRGLEKVDWLHFDDQVRDGALDADECAVFVETLLRRKDAHVIRSVDELDKDPFDSHPAMRRRILYLAANLPLTHRGDSVPRA